MNNKLLCSKRSLINLSIVVLLFALPYLLINYQDSYSTPFESLQNNTSKTNQIFMVEEIFSSSKLNNEVFIFFINKKHSISVALFEKGLFGWKNTGMYSCELNVANVDPNVLIPGISSGGDRILYGLTTSLKIDYILVDKQVAVEIPVGFNLRNKSIKISPNLKMWYIFLNNSNSENKIEVMDKSGNLITVQG